MGWLLIGLLLLATPAWAEPFLDLGLGATKFFPTVPEGSWWQEPFPHSFGTTDFAWRAGLGWRFNEHWSVAGSYIDMGAATSRELQVLDIEHNFATRSCIANCTRPFDVRVRSPLHGPELSVKYTWPFAILSPFVRVGGAWVHNKTTWSVLNNTPDRDTGPGGTLEQSFLMALGGVGVCYRWVCAEATYYEGRHFGADNGFTIATNALVSMMSLNVPLW